MRTFVVAVLLCLASVLGRAQSNLVLLVSQPGDYIGQGATYVATNTSEFTFSGTSDLISVSAFGFQIHIGGQSPLGVGTYTNVMRWPFGFPGLDVSGNGRGCNTVCGGFEILEMHLDAAGQVDRFWARLTNICECFMAPLTGEIRFQSQLAPVEPLPRTLRVPEDFPSIGAALTNASLLTVDTVLVAPGTYNESVAFHGKRAYLVSAEGPAVTFIVPPPNASAVNFSAGESASAVVSGFTLSNGLYGVYVSSASPTIVSNLIVNCGTGIDSSFSSPTIRGNRIVGGGTGIALGGAAAPLLEGNVIETNALGISMFAAGNPIIRNNVIRHNSGDGMNMVNQSDANIIQNVIVGNTGNGISWLVPSGARGPWVIANTIVDNGPTTGAGIAADGFDAAALVADNIIVGRQALWVGGFNDRNPPIVQFNDIYSPVGAAYSGLVSNLTGVARNISVDPWFACQPGGDFHLLAGSPCLDVGTNLSGTTPATDFDGNPRILASNTNSPGGVDLGAFEFNPAVPPAPCLYLTCPSNRVVTVPGGQTNATVSYPAPIATPVATIATVPPSGSAFPVGTNVVICTATYGTNTVTCAFSVTVLAQPGLAEQPQNADVPAGQSVELSVVATGSGPLRYNWLFEGTPIPGATNASLNLRNPQAEDEGAYLVLVSNGVGSITSRVALLRVLPAAPQIVAGPAPLTIPAGSNATFYATTYGSAPMDVLWLKDGVPLAGATNVQLVISNAQLANAGGYQLVLSNSLGTATSAAVTLSVIPSAPFFILQPGDATGVVGTNLVLTSLAGGSAPISYQWRLNGSPVDGADQSTLAISNVMAASAGAYDVVAGNGLGKATSAVARVIVNQPPLIQQGLTNLIADVGSNVTLSVSASGSGTLAYTWSFNGGLAKAAGPSLVLTNVQSRESGDYRVTVSSEFGSAGSIGRVSIVGPISTVRAWGDNTAGQTAVPGGLNNIVAVAGGDYFSVALRRDGTLVAWGSNLDGETSVPASEGPFVGIAAGAGHGLAITASGGVVAWGRNDKGQTLVSPAAKSVLSVAAGESHSLALLSSGIVLAWGDNEYGQAKTPTTLSGVRAIAAGRNHSLALRGDGTVVGWGLNTFGQATPPTGLGGVAGVAAGYLHSAALRTNGTVVAWGDNSFGQTTVPADLSNVVAIAAGDLHTVALRADGSVVAWGDNLFGQTNVPPSATGVTGIAAGYYHSLALLPSAARLRIRWSLDSLVLDWAGSGTLQWAPTLSDPFTDVPGFSGTYTNTDWSTPARFFRLR